MGEGKYYRFEKEYFVGENGVEWANESIEAGDKTRLEDIEEYDEITLFFKSDTAGNWDIQVVTPAGSRRTYDTVSVSADSLEIYVVTGTIDRIGLKFDTGARVEAWFNGKIKKYYKG